MNSRIHSWTGSSLVTEVELRDQQSLSTLRHIDEQKHITYERAHILVRLDGQPIGMADIPFDGTDLEPSTYFDRIAHTFGDEIRKRLQISDSRVDGADLAGALAAFPSKDSQPAFEPGKAPLVSIIIGTRNHPDKLRLTLAQMLLIDYPTYEIIVVDNAPSDDRTQNLVEADFHSPKIRYVCEKLAGLSNARNRGIVEARGELIAIADDDVLVDRQWLNALVSAFQQGDNVACVTGLILPAELETPAQAWLESYGGFSRGYERYVYDLDKHRPKSVLYPYSAGIFGSGANMAFTKAFLCQINGFDTALGAGTSARGGEDLAIFVKVITSGAQLVYEPNAILYHFHAREYENLRTQMYCYGVGLVAYILKIVFDEPWRIIPIGIRLPAAVFHILSPKSRKNINKDTLYPSELTRLERIGMLHGPFLFLRSLRESGQLFKSRNRQLCL